MDLHRLALSLRKWAIVFVLLAAVGAQAAYYVAQRTPPVYRASSTVLVSQASTPTQFNYNDLLASQGLAKTYAQWMTMRPILEQVISNLSLHMDPGYLAGQISVQPVAGTSLLTINVEDGDPQRAAAIANELPRVFIQAYGDTQSNRFGATEQTLLQNLSSVQAQVGDAQKRLDTMLAAKPPADPADVDRARAILAQEQSTYSALLKNYQDIQLAKATSQDNVVVIGPATVPFYPARPNRTLNMLIGVVVGLMLASGIYVLVEYLQAASPVVRTAEQAQQLGLPVLGVVRQWRRKNGQRSTIATFDPLTPMANACRLVWANLSLSPQGKQNRSLLITSAKAGEGKSTIASNLATVVALSGYSVVLVDADLYRPAQHTFCDVPNEQGLSNVLRGQSTWESVIQPTSLKNLRVITSGPVPPNPTDLLGMRYLKQLVEALQKQADCVIFDGPPILPTADAIIIGSKVDGVLIVVGAGQVKRSVLGHASVSLTRIGANVVGTVLNRVRSDTGTDDEAYHYTLSTLNTLDGNHKGPLPVEANSQPPR